MRQTGRALGSVSLHTFTHAKWALLTLLGRRQVSLPHCAIPLRSDCHSILPFGKQPGWYYRSLLQTAAAKLWLMRNKGMCRLVCTHTLPAARGLEGMPSYSASMKWGCFRHSAPSPGWCMWHVTSRLGGFISEILEFITIRKKPLCLLPLSVNAQNL